MMKNRAVLLPIVALMCIVSGSCVRKADILTVGGWKILCNQADLPEEALAKYGWSDIEVPSTFMLPYAPGKGLQFAWLRGECTIAGDPSEYHGISLGRIYYTDRVFINGRLVGSESISDMRIMCHARNYVIPQGVLKTGVNTVLVQIGMFRYEHGGIVSPVQILKESDFTFRVRWGNIMYMYLPLVAISIACLVLFLLAVFFLWNRSERIYLYTSFGLLVFIIYFATMFIPFTNVSFLIIKFIHWTVIQFFSIVILLIVQSLYAMYLPLYQRVVIPALLVVALGNFLALLLVYRVENLYTHYIGDILGIATVLVCVPLTVRLVLQLNRIRPDAFKCAFLIFISVAVGLVIVIQIYLANMRGRFTFLPVLYIALLVLLLFTIFFARSLMNKNKELAHLYDSLREEEPVINDLSREKLDKIVAFIRENYTSDLSREGLAAAVGLNPNYMSTLFRKYTGMKINDYINKLRIDEAVRKLSDSETKVIEIAYAVGFESLTTFNRVFKTVMGKTPTEYRDMP